MSDVITSKEEFISRINIDDMDLNITLSSHFIFRWNTRVDSKCACHFNNSVESNDLILMGRGVDNSYHLLYRDIDNNFFILIIASDGVVKTILPEEYYMTHSNAMNLSTHKDSYGKKSTKLKTKNIDSLNQSNAAVKKENKRLRQRVASLEAIHSNTESIHNANKELRLEIAKLNDDNESLKLISDNEKSAILIDDINKLKSELDEANTKIKKMKRRSKPLDTNPAVDQLMKQNRKLQSIIDNSNTNNEIVTNPPGIIRRFINNLSKRN